MKTLLPLMVLLLFGSCATATVVVPENLSPAEIIQRAQEALDRNRYNTAIQYYQTLIERNPYNLNLVCEAEYAIAFIKYKQKKYEEAKEKFNKLLERYDDPFAESLPPHFRVLARKVLEQIGVKEKQGFFRKKPKE